MKKITLGFMFLSILSFSLFGLPSCNNGGGENGCHASTDDNPHLYKDANKDCECDTCYGYDCDNNSEREPGDPC